MSITYVYTAFLILLRSFFFFITSWDNSPVSLDISKDQLKVS